MTTHPTHEVALTIYDEAKKSVRSVGRRARRREHLISIFERHGFVVDHLGYGTELDGQSAVYLRIA